MSTQSAVKFCLKVSSLFLVQVINKVDRLILELKLPPQDAYYKIMHTIEDANKIIVANSASLMESPLLLRPDRGNVCFSSGQHGWSFTLESFAHLYVSRYPGTIDPDDLAKRLWGDWYHDAQENSFTKTKPHGSAVRTFIQFVLEPLYKIYSQVIGEAPDDLARTLRKLGVHLKTKEIHMDPKPLLRLALSKFFANPGGFVGMVVKHFPSPIDGAEKKVTNNYAGEAI